MNYYTIDLVKCLSKTLKEVIDKAAENQDLHQYPPNITDLLILLITQSARNGRFGNELKNIVES